MEQGGAALRIEFTEHVVKHQHRSTSDAFGDQPVGGESHGQGQAALLALRGLHPCRHAGDEQLELVHRLDRDTSGCLLVARKRSALRALHELLREGLFEKRYLTLVKGPWDLGKKCIDVALRTDTRVGGERTVRVAPNGKPAISDFRPVQFFGNRATLLEVAIQTGRTHQIRVHAAHVGHPVAGDEKYGDEEFNEAMKAFGLNRMFLHAHSVGFDWPQGGAFSASAPLPPELSAVIDRLGASPAATKSQRSRGGRRTR